MAGAGVAPPGAALAGASAAKPNAAAAAKSNADFIMFSCFSCEAPCTAIAAHWKRRATAPVPVPFPHEAAQDEIVDLHKSRNLSSRIMLPITGRVSK